MCRRTVSSWMRTDFAATPDQLAEARRAVRHDHRTSEASLGRCQRDAPLVIWRCARGGSSNGTGWSTCCSRRGIVAGDVVRRLVSRTIAQQLSATVETATAPHQCALSTKAGTECIAHVLQSLTELHPEATVTSIDGITAYDLIPGKRCHKGSHVWKEEGRRSHLCASSMGLLRSICGRMSLAQPMEFRKRKAESKEMR